LALFPSTPGTFIVSPNPAPCINDVVEYASVIYDRVTSNLQWTLTNNMMQTAFVTLPLTVLGTFSPVPDQQIGLPFSGAVITGCLSCDFWEVYAVAGLDVYKTPFNFTCPLNLAIFPPGELIFLQTGSTYLKAVCTSQPLVSITSQIFKVNGCLNESDYIQDYLCTPCPAGMELNPSNQSAFILCPQGSYRSISMSQCSSCDSESESVSCPVGSRSPIPVFFVLWNGQMHAEG